MYLIYMPSKYEERTPDRATDILDNVQLTVNFIREIIIPQTSPLWAQMGLFRASARECHICIYYVVCQIEAYLFLLKATEHHGEIVLRHKWLKSLTQLDVHKLHYY